LEAKDKNRLASVSALKEEIKLTQDNIKTKRQHAANNATPIKALLKRDSSENGIVSKQFEMEIDGIDEEMK